MHANLYKVIKCGCKYLSSYFLLLKRGLNKQLEHEFTSRVNKLHEEFVESVYTETF